MAKELRSNFQIPENSEFPEVLPKTRRQQRTMVDPNEAAAAADVPEILITENSILQLKQFLVQWLLESRKNMMPRSMCLLMKICSQNISPLK